MQPVGRFVRLDLNIREIPGAIQHPNAFTLFGIVEGMIDRAELTAALDAIWQRVRRLNRYVEERAPWQLAKDDARAGELDCVLSTLIAGLRVLAVLLHPYMPSSADKLLDALGCHDRSLASARWDSVEAVGKPIAALESLFPKSS